MLTDDYSGGLFTIYFGFRCLEGVLACDAKRFVVCVECSLSVERLLFSRVV